MRYIPGLGQMGNLRAVGALLFLLSNTALASQLPERDAVHSFADLEEVLEVGDHVVVTDLSGAELRGRVAGLSASALTLEQGGQQVVSATSVARIRRTDSSVEGVVIGAGAGLATAMVGISRTRGRSDSFYPWYYIGSWALPLVGAAVGYAIDRSIGNETVFERSIAGGSLFGVSPYVGDAGAGLTISLAF